MPYAVALLWGLSVAPPDLREMLASGTVVFDRILREPIAGEEAA